MQVGDLVMLAAPKTAEERTRLGEIVDVDMSYTFPYTVKWSVVGPLPGTLPASSHVLAILDEDAWDYHPSEIVRASAHVRAARLAQIEAR